MWVLSPYHYCELISFRKFSSNAYVLWRQRMLSGHNSDNWWPAINPAGDCTFPVDPYLFWSDCTSSPGV